MDNCIFCRIAQGEIPSATVFEDEDVRVILDMNQAIKGHMLILPKKHYENLYELPEDLAAKTMIVAKKMAEASRDALDAEGMNLLQNNGETAGQSVMHFHLHVLPRKKGDDSFPRWKEITAAGDELNETARMIREKL